MRSRRVRSRDRSSGKCGCRYRQTFRHLVCDTFSLCADCVADKLPKIRVVLRYETGKLNHCDCSPVGSPTDRQIKTALAPHPSSQPTAEIAARLASSVQVLELVLSPDLEDSQ